MDARATPILKAFGEDTRLRILRILSAQELSVGELVDVLRVPQPRISRHLGVLRAAGLVRDRRDGNRIYCSMPAGRLEPFAQAVWQAICDRRDNERLLAGDSARLQRVLARRKQRSKAYFDAVASEWDKIRRNYIQDALPFLVVANLLRPDAVAVDVGTGTGEALLALAGAAAKVIGVDSSEKMLEACRARVAEAGLDNVELRLGDAEDLPLADAECHTALASMVLHHLSDPLRGVREMARVVRPGGKVVIIDLIRHGREWAREVMADLWLGFAEQQLRDWLSQAGLDEVTYSVSAIPSPLEPDSPDKLPAFIAVATKPAAA